MNVNGVVFQATALQLVANDLQRSINQVKEPKVPGDVDWSRWVTGYVSSTLILRALGNRTDAQGPILQEVKRISDGREGS